MFDPVPALVLKNQFGEESVNFPSAGTNFVAAYKSAVLTLTAAEVIALNATPKTLIPAVTGKLIQLVALVISYTYGSAAFTITSGKHLIAQYATSAILSCEVLEAGLIDQTANKEAVVFGPGAGGVSIVGEAMEITSDDSAISGGTGASVAITGYYNLLG